MAYTGITETWLGPDWGESPFEIWSTNFSVWHQLTPWQLSSESLLKISGSLLHKLPDVRPSLSTWALGIS